MRAVAILLAVLALSAMAEEVTVDGPETIVDEILLIHDEMKDMEGLLRDDRTGPPVQVQGKVIIDALDKLIKEIEDAKETDKRPKGKPLAERWKKVTGAGEGGQGVKKPIRSGHDAHLHEGPDYRNAWNQLGKRFRDEVLQTYGEEISLRWKKRIEAYFISLAAEDKGQKLKEEEDDGD